MGRASGRKRRVKQKFQYNVNRKKLLKKKRQLPKILCPQIKAAWEDGCGIEKNMSMMGLVSNVNKAVEIPSAKQMMMSGSKRKRQKKKTFSKKGYVAAELEALAKAPQPQRFRVSNGHVLFVTNLMEKYGEDYEAMARDPSNHYQQTPAQIRRKIKDFKNIPEQYNEYLRSKMDTST